MKIGILGAGNIARSMAITINAMENHECYAIASRTLEKAEAFQKEYGFTKAYGSYEELLSDEAVDLVYIATPHTQHMEWALKCIEHKKPALVEKAFTVNAIQAEKVLKAAKENHVLVAEAIWPRYMPFVQKMKEVLDSGVIGTPSLLTANLGYDIDHIPRLQNPDLAGGALLDVGVYPLNFACMMFGTDIAEIVSTCTYTETGVDEQNSITLKYKDGKMAVLNSSLLSISDRKGIIYGDKGFIIVENINNFASLTVYDKSYQPIESYNAPKQISGYEYEVDACAEAIANGQIEIPAMTHQMTIDMMKIMDQVRRDWGIKYPCEKL